MKFKTISKRDLLSHFTDFISLYRLIFIEEIEGIQGLPLKASSPHFGRSIIIYSVNIVFRVTQLLYRMP